MGYVKQLGILWKRRSFAAAKSKTSVRIRKDKGAMWFFAYVCVYAFIPSRIYTLPDKNIGIGNIFFGIRAGELWF
jgi:hypothetical protein